jgi:hypothetical protein
VRPRGRELLTAFSHGRPFVVQPRSRERSHLQNAERKTENVGKSSSEPFLT